MSFRLIRRLTLALALVGATAATTFFLVTRHGHAGPLSVPAAAERSYEGQKVIYHISEGAGLMNRNAKRWVGNMENHFAATPKGDLSLVVVMNGDGVDLLAAAKTDGDLAARIDKLRAKGARFLVCRNTLVSRGIDPATDLHGVGPQDIVPAGVAEIAYLETKGYGYLRP